MRQDERLVSRACPSKKNVSFRCSNLDPHTGQKLVTARPSKVARNILMDCEPGILSIKVFTTAMVQTSLKGARVLLALVCDRPS
jgi:hypothetical protein